MVTSLKNRFNILVILYLCPVFYGLPKVHKKDIPLRPICSQIAAPTCHINELVDHYLYIAEQHVGYYYRILRILLLLTYSYLRNIKMSNLVPS